ncbi:GNAT family N-acetyltransferase [Mesorhizobium sp. M6A.T.Ce.TU.016.01.1.1]|uniref:GNAT family N-acetyltransferase n=1 Tax=Mesorhizobium sp. M6A.T.Ce.TU.016.01.1.1 TaxID=2496783 RepID=UPI000FCB1FB6|nr:GNAT family N-acetyltransferase [Mesorhizobium sp. M6A.T.Ce.TU.016.01.1.1]RUU27199.1 GNAT family N-acetyltransferase [Mesorhizobium sp. M6A.T.Ce.TU.016.01.1.1]
MTTRSKILYASEPTLDAAEFRRVLVESGLGATRPTDDEARLKTMLASADMVLTARLDAPGKPLIGLARGVTDFSWVCYISELAVCKSAQGLGIGKGLLDEVRRQLGPAVAISLISVPDAVGFYERIGMTRMADAFWFGREH